MKICQKCKQVNEDNATVCYNCGRKFTKSDARKKVMKIVLSILIIAAIGGAGYGVWFFLQPKCFIHPEINEITMNGDGETREVNINTNAPFDKWEAVGLEDWVHVTKREKSIIIKCDENDRNEVGNRLASVLLYCTSVRREHADDIEIRQGGNTKTIRGEIKQVRAFYSNDSESLVVKVKCRIYNLAEGAIRCALWFYHEDGTKLIDTNREYCTSDGQVTVQERVWTDFTDDYTFKLSIPISELHLSKSEEIRIDVGLFEYNSDEDGRRFVREKEAKTFYVAQ